MSPDCLLGVIPQPTDSRLSETMSVHGFDFLWLPVRALRNSNIFSRHSESAIPLIYIYDLLQRRSLSVSVAASRMTWFHVLSAEQWLHVFWLWYLVCARTFRLKKPSRHSVVRCKMCSRHTIHLWIQIIMCKRHIVLHSARFLSICPSISWMFLASTRWSFVVRSKSRKPKPRRAKEMKQARCPMHSIFWWDRKWHGLLCPRKRGGKLVANTV